MEFIMERCIICGEELFQIDNDKKQRRLFNSWNVKCSESLSDVLLGSESDSLIYYFRNGGYCSSCQQSVRDVNFAWTLLKSLQNKINSLSRRLRKRLFENYHNIPEKAEENVMEERLKILRNENDSFQIYSYNEIIEIIYFVASRFSGDVYQEDIKNDIKYPINHVEVKIEPDLTYETESNYGDTLNDNGMESHSSDEEMSAELKIRKTVGKDSSKNEGAKRKSKINEKDAKRKARHEASVAKRKIRQERRNVWRRAQRLNNPNHYKRIKCTYENCPITFKTEENKQIHIRQIHLGEKKPFECPKCSKRFKSNPSLTSHLINLHSGNRSFEHSCKFCGKGYQEEGDLNSHYEVAHQGPNPFACAFCEKEYSNSSELHKHVSDFHPNFEKPQCDICNKFFANRQSLKVHKLIHNDPDLLHKCDICNRAYATPQRLRQHKDTHNEENSFCCEFCGKSFRYQSALRKHAEFHTKEKRFKCKVCGMGFVKPGACSKHEITHSGVKNWICKICSKAFSVKSNLNDHERIHEREKDPTIVVRKRNTASRPVL